jgi:hypothetical protein
MADFLKFFQSLDLMGNKVKNASDGVDATDLVTKQQLDTVSDVADSAQADADTAQGNVDNLVTLSGVAKDALSLGEFNGTTINDDSTVKGALQALEIAVENSASALEETIQDTVGAMATDSSEIDFTYDDVANTFTANIKADSIDKTMINADVAGGGLAQDTDGSLKVNDGSGLEIDVGGVLNVKVEGSTLEVSGNGVKVSDATMTLISDAQTAADTAQGNVDNLVTLSGVAKDSTDLGEFTGTTIVDDSTIKDALQALETAVEDVGSSVTLQGVYDNSTATGGIVEIVLAADKALKFKDNNDETYMKIDPDANNPVNISMTGIVEILGDMTISGELTINGATTQIDSVVTNSDHLALKPAGSAKALDIEPDVAFLGETVVAIKGVSGGANIIEVNKTDLEAKISKLNVTGDTALKGAVTLTTGKVIDFGANVVTNVADGIEDDDVAAFGQIGAAIDAEVIARDSAISDAIDAEVIARDSAISDAIDAEDIILKAYVDDKKYTATLVADGVVTEFELQHGLGTEDVLVQVRSAGNKQVVMPAIEMTTSDSVTIKFSTAPLAANGNFKVVIFS